jgi:hypothetical protein
LIKSLARSLPGQSRTAAAKIRRKQRLAELIDECVRHALLDDHARRGRAGLAFVVEASFERVMDGTTDIRVVEYYERVLSTELEQCWGV